VLLAALLVVGVPLAYLYGRGGGFDGVVYVESGSPAENAVLAVRYRGNRLTGGVRRYATGGRAGGPPTPAGRPGAQPLAFDHDRRLLVAADAGSGTLAAFRVGTDGRLQAVRGSPFPAGAASPTSLGLADDLVLVAGAGGDGRPRLAATRIEPDDRLGPLAASVALPPGAAPASALALPQAAAVVVALAGGSLASFRIEPDGALAQAGRPLAAPRVSGLAAHPRLPLLYAVEAGGARLVVYRYGQTGLLRLAGAAGVARAAPPAAIAVSGDGRHLLTASARDGTVSSFLLDDPERPRLVQTLTLRPAGRPSAIAMTPNGGTAFVVDGRGRRLHALRITGDGTIAQTGSSVSLQGGAGAQPLGAVVLTR